MAAGQGHGEGRRVCCWSWDRSATLKWGNVDARSPEPKADDRPVLLAEDSGYTGIPIVLNQPIPKMSWWCDGAQLTVQVRGPWILDARDIPSALENLIRDLRAEGLDPQVDAVGIVLEAILYDESARFDSD